MGTEPRLHPTEMLPRPCVYAGHTFRLAIPTCLFNNLSACHVFTVYKQPYDNNSENKISNLPDINFRFILCIRDGEYHCCVSI